MSALSRSSCGRIRAIRSSSEGTVGNAGASSKFSRLNVARRSVIGTGPPSGDERRQGGPVRWPREGGAPADPRPGFVPRGTRAAAASLVAVGAFARRENGGREPDVPGGVATAGAGTPGPDRGAVMAFVTSLSPSVGWEQIGRSRYPLWTEELPSAASDEDVHRSHDAPCAHAV